jgi:DNA-binding FadR family transcriptional regulator
MMLFLGRDAGVMVLIKLVQKAGALEGRRLELSYEDTGALFGVSRTHVRKVLQDAEQDGLVALSGRGLRCVELKPAVWRAFDRFVAESMSGHDLLFRIALRQMNASARAPDHSTQGTRGPIAG